MYIGNEWVNTSGRDVFSKITVFEFSSKFTRLEFVVSKVTKLISQKFECVTNFFVETFAIV